MSFGIGKTGAGISVGYGGAICLAANGKTFSSKVTWRERMILLDRKSRQRKPLWSVGYPKNTQGADRGTSLCGVMGSKFGWLYWTGYASRG